MEEVLLLLKTLADRTRLEILLALQEQGRTIRELTGKLELTQPTVSFHLHKLREAGVVEVDTVGSSDLYTLCPSALDLNLLGLLSMIQNGESLRRLQEKQGIQWYLNHSLREDGRYGILPSRYVVALDQKLLELLEPERFYSEETVMELGSSVLTDPWSVAQRLVQTGALSYGRRLRPGGDPHCFRDYRWYYWIPETPVPAGEIDNAL